MLTRKPLSVIVALHSMTTTTKQDWIRDLKALANENYGEGYGWQVLVECYDTTDWLDLVEDCETYEEARARAARIASIHQDRHDDANAEIL